MVDMDIVKQCIGVDEKDLLEILTRKNMLEEKAKIDEKRIDDLIYEISSVSAKISELRSENEILRRKMKKKKNKFRILKLKMMEDNVNLKSLLYEFECNRIINNDKKLKILRIVK